MILLIVVGITRSCYIYLVHSGIWSDCDRDGIIHSLATVDIFSEFLFHFHPTRRIHGAEGFLDDVIVGVDVFCESIGNFFTGSSSEGIVCVTDEYFFLIGCIVSTDRDESIVGIIGVLVFSLEIEDVTYKVTIVVVEETSYERSGGVIVKNEKRKSTQ